MPPRCLRQKEIRREAPGTAREEASKVLRSDKTATHKSSPASPRPACSCWGRGSPEKSGTGLSRERAGANAAWRISPLSEPHAQDEPSPPVQGRHGRGWPGTRPGSARGGGGGKEPPGSPGSRRWEYQYSISVIASDQSAQPGGRVSVAGEQPTTESQSKGGRTAPCFKEKFGRIGVVSSTQLLMMFAWC